MGAAAEAATLAAVSRHALRRDAVGFLDRFVGRNQDARTQRYVVRVLLRRSPPSASQLLVSPDRRRFAYWTLTSRGNYEIVGVELRSNVRHSEGIVLNAILFSPDSRRLAFGIRQRGAQAFVVDDETKTFYDALGNETAVFSWDSRRFAYCAERAGRRFVVVDDVEYGAYDGILGGVPVFSPDSRRFAFIGRRGRSSLVNCEGREKG